MFKVFLIIFSLLKTSGVVENENILVENVNFLIENHFLKTFVVYFLASCFVGNKIVVFFSNLVNAFFVLFVFVGYVFLFKNHKKVQFFFKILILFHCVEIYKQISQEK